MKTNLSNLPEDYHLGLTTVQSGHLGKALILARNGLRSAQISQELFHQAAFQSLFARIHLADEDRDSARRALKLMAQLLSCLQGTSQTWAKNEYELLSRQIESTDHQV